MDRSLLTKGRLLTLLVPLSLPLCKCAMHRARRCEAQAPVCDPALLTVYSRESSAQRPWISTTFNPICPRQQAFTLISPSNVRR